MKQYHFPTSGGYSLIELMIVVGLVAILATVAYPSFQEQIRRSSRTEGKQSLLDAAALEERYYSDNNVYAALATVGINATTENGKYTLSITGLGGTNQSYTLVATPTFTDTLCEAFSLRSDGLKTEGGTGSVSDCWSR